MSLFSQLAILVISLTGILCGIALSYISPEELVPGKKYFLLVKRIIHLMFILLIGYLAYSEKNYWLLIPLILALSLLIMQFKLEKINYYSESANYLIFISPYFFISQNNFQLLLAVLIFLYGLPTGTLLRKINRKKI